MFFFLRRPLIHETTSWKTPKGQITEQYTRPKTNVNNNRATTIPTFNANRAGRNWILASQPSHTWIVPVKSRNNNVINAKKSVASVNLILRSISKILNRNHSLIYSYETIQALNSEALFLLT